MVDGRIPWPGQRLKHWAAIIAVLTWAFAGGFVPELRHTDSWPTTAIVSGVIVLATLAIVGDRESVSLWMIVEGTVVSAMASVLWVLGDFLPYAVHLGGRDPADYVPDAGSTALPATLVFYGLLGGGIGLVVGGLALIFKLIRTQAWRATHDQGRGSPP